MRDKVVQKLLQNSCTNIISLIYLFDSEKKKLIYFIGVDV